MPFPTFYVIGNHDEQDLRRPEETFSVARFEEEYGPTNFSFDFRNSLFIVLRMNRQEMPPESVEFLRSELESKSDLYDRVFVFMHIPPRLSYDFDSKITDGGGELVDLFDKYRVDYVICGDYHGYARLKRNETVYLISGGGGSHFRKDRPGHFHHAIVLTVRDNGEISEQIRAAGSTRDVMDKLQHFAAARFLPWTQGQSGFAHCPQYFGFHSLFFLLLL